MQGLFGLSRSLFIITDPDARQNDVEQHLLGALRGGATHLVLRRPKASATSLYTLATTYCSTFRDEATWNVLVHDRVDVALGAHAQGAHLPKDGLPGSVAKALLGQERMLGASVHTRGEASSAALQMADYLMFGHVYETESHPGKPGRGLDALRELCEHVPSLPVIAVGGITPDRVDEVLAAGASGVAVIRAISRADDPETATRAFRAALDAADYPHLQPIKEEI